MPLPQKRTNFHHRHYHQDWVMNVDLAVGGDDGRCEVGATRMKLPMLVRQLGSAIADRILPPTTLAN